MLFLYPESLTANVVSSGYDFPSRFAGRDSPLKIKNGGIRIVPTAFPQATPVIVSLLSPLTRKPVLVTLTFAGACNSIKFCKTP